MLSGNSPSYDFSQIKPLAGSPLQGGHIAVLGSSVARGEASEGWAVGGTTGASAFFRSNS